MVERSILFVCAGNTCRSVIAEAFARRRFGADAFVTSAGLRPQNPEDATAAIETLSFEFGINAAGHQPKHVGAVDLNDFTHVVALDKQIAKALRQITDREIIVWDVHDPRGDNPFAYKRCALKIKQLVARL